MTYEMNIVAELADNEPSGCRRVVHFHSSKQGHFVGICAWPSSFLIGGWDGSEILISR